MPEKIGNLPGKLIYIHKCADYENYVCTGEGGDEVVANIYRKEDDGTFTHLLTVPTDNINDVNSVGNTLIFATTDGLHYLLYKGGEYIDLGTTLPTYTFLPRFATPTEGRDVEVKGEACVMDGLAEMSGTYAKYDSNGDFIEESTDASTGGKNFCRWRYKDDTKAIHDSLQEAFQGGFASSRTNAREQGCFCFPFFIRVALRLYDGSFARISNPIACFPTSDRNCEYLQVRWNSDEKSWVFDPSTHSGSGYYFYCKLKGSPLYFKMQLSDNYENWKDIVSGYVVFATEEVLTFELEEEWSIVHPNESHDRSILYNYDYSDEDIIIHFSNVSDGRPAQDIIMPTYKSDRAIREDLLAKTTFYKLFEVNFEDFGKYTSYVNAFDKELYDKHTIGTLAEQEQLDVDDYYGWCKLEAENIFPYNNRMNMFSLERYPYEGPFVFQANNIQTGGTTLHSNYTIYTHIVSDKMDAWAKCTGTPDSNAFLFPASSLVGVQNGWYYYPDPNATEMIIQDGSGKLALLALKKHPRLNGAYTFECLPNERKALPWGNTTTTPIVDLSAHETLDSNIYSTNINNPFTFNASGDNTVGTGSIIALAANTDAISQGQFGEFPLIVFTTEGIYAMGVNSEGAYVNIYPISREVCNNAESVTPVDDYVFFTSERGLMAVRGRQVVCVSGQLRGRVPRNFIDDRVGFIKYLAECKIAYDYRDSLLLIFNEEYPAYHYVYNIQEKTFAVDTTKLNTGVQAIASSYPDSVIQDKDGNLYTLTGKPEINEDEGTYSGHVITHPLRFGSLPVLKSLRQVKHLIDTDNGTLGVKLYGSNDCKHWQELTSLKGKPWKFFTIEYSFANLAAADAFSGTLLTYIPRRTDKLR